MYQIIDEFLPIKEFKELQSIFDDRFPWMISDNITTSKGIYTNNRSYGFFHTVVDDYNIEVGLPKLRPIIRYLVNKVFAVTNTNKLLRARLDMVTYTGKNEYIHNPHTDFKGELIKNKSIVYYINETDGDTILYKEKIDKNFSIYDKIPKSLNENIRVSPKPNRILIFDGDIIHTGCSPIKYRKRIILNGNVINE
jgi:hypothetical protein